MFGRCRRSAFSGAFSRGSGSLAQRRVAETELRDATGIANDSAPRLTHRTRAVHGRVSRVHLVGPSQVAARGHRRDPSQLS
jgi:hypothetical protein